MVFILSTLPTRTGSNLPALDRLRFTTRQWKEDRQAILAAIVEAEEIATAIPSVAFYVSDKPGSIHRLLADGLCLKIEQGGPRAVIYAAENHNHAAEILEGAVMDLIPQEKQAAIRQRVRFLNTVIGKMSQVVADPLEVKARNLAPITPGYSRAFLVEAFNRILISKIQFAEVLSTGHSRVPGKGRPAAF